MEGEGEGEVEAGVEVDENEDEHEDNDAKAAYTVNTSLASPNLTRLTYLVSSI